MSEPESYDDRQANKSLQQCPVCRQWFWTARPFREGAKCIVCEWDDMPDVRDSPSKP